MLHSLLLVVALGDIEVSLVLSVVTCFSSVPLRSIVPSSSPSSFECSSSSPQVRRSSQHHRLVTVIIQDQGVTWEAWGPSIHEVPWSSAQGQLQAPSGVPLQGPSP